MPADVSVSSKIFCFFFCIIFFYIKQVHLHRLESRLSITKEFQRCRSISPNVDEHLEPLKTHKIDISANTSAIPLQRGSNLNSSEPFLTNMQNPTSIDQYLNDRIEPKQKIIIEGVSRFKIE